MKGNHEKTHCGAMCWAEHAENVWEIPNKAPPSMQKILKIPENRGGKCCKTQRKSQNDAIYRAGNIRNAFWKHPARVCGGFFPQIFQQILVVLKISRRIIYPADYLSDSGMSIIDRLSVDYESISI